MKKGDKQKQIEKVNSKALKRIRKVLTDEQVTRYKQLRKSTCFNLAGSFNNDEQVTRYKQLRKELKEQKDSYYKDSGASEPIDEDLEMDF